MIYRSSDFVGELTVNVVEAKALDGALGGAWSDVGWCLLMLRSDGGRHDICER